MGRAEAGGNKGKLRKHEQGASLWSPVEFSCQLSIKNSDTKLGDGAHL